jgi:DNA polymerase-3 subunit delta'
MWLPEKMRTETANALLKILEEPEEKTVFLLVAENDETIPVTILSRTQLVKVNRLTDEDIFKGLSLIPDTDAKVAKTVSRRAEGNYRIAQQLLEEEDPDADDATLFLEWMRACLKLNIVRIQELCDQLAAIGRERQKAFFEYSLSIVRECLLINYGDEKLVRIEGKEKDNFKRFAPFIHQGNAERFIQLLDEAHYHVERNANYKMLFMDLSFKIFQLLNSK